jgi:uncharacterized Tic20 family protein
MVNRPDRVQIWASQLAANDFPPVCAMSGQPAETWRKFKFSTPPTWTYALLILICLGGIGIILYAVVVTLVSQKASGYLPLTKAARNRLNIFIGVVVALLPVSFIMFFVGLAVGSSSDSTSSAISVALVIVGVVLFVAFLVGALTRSLFGPGARVIEPALGQTDRLVELRRVHPAFVSAVQQQHAARMTQTAGSN